MPEANKLTVSGIAQLPSRLHLKYRDMDGELDPELQRIINTATGIHSENRAAAPLNYLFMDNRQKQWSFGAAPSRQPMHDVIPFNGSSQSITPLLKYASECSNFTEVESFSTTIPPAGQDLTSAPPGSRWHLAIPLINQRLELSQTPTITSDLPRIYDKDRLLARCLQC